MSQGAGTRGWQFPPTSASSRAIPQPGFVSTLAAAQGVPAEYAPVAGDTFLQLLPASVGGRQCTGAGFLNLALGSASDPCELGLYEEIAGVLTRVATTGMFTGYLGGPLPGVLGSTADARLHARGFATPYTVSRTAPTYAALMIGSIPAPPCAARLVGTSLSHLTALHASFSMPSVGLHLALFQNSGTSLPATIDPPPESISNATRPALGASFQKRVLAYGDSITEVGAGIAGPAQTWPARLQGMVGPNGYLINAGVSGNRVIGTGGLRNATRLLRDAYHHYPADIFVFGGSPDLCNDTATAAALETDYALLLDALHANLPTATIRCVTVLPYGNSACPPNEQARLDFNTWLRAGQGGRSYGVVDLEPTMAVFDGTEWDLVAAFDGGDGQHPNAAGELEIARQIYSQAYASTPFVQL